MSKILTVLLLGLGALGFFAIAQSADEPVADPRVGLLKLLPAGSKLEDLRPSPIPGIYEYSQGAEVSYLTADG
ncbi:MAG: disulfide isomerase DsbC N-terminal domain-containing protein, partial [Steroidobacteraceae bacterium]